MHIILLMGLGVACLLFGTLFIQAQKARPVVDLAKGEQLFQTHCASCHGPQGEGGQGPTLAVPKLIRAPDTQSLSTIIREGISGTEMPGSELDKNQLRQIAAWVRKLGRLPAEKVPGNSQRGERLYFTKGKCAQCHAIRGQGGASGGDLTEIGLRRGSAYLRTALIDPEADVPVSFSEYRPGVSITENFLQVRTVTKDGRRVDGVRLNEDTFSIQIRDSSDRIHSFYKSDLLELHKDWGKSSMPGYRDVFSKDELDDVVAYLVSLRGEK